jgi:hypothetical protein
MYRRMTEITQIKQKIVTVKGGDVVEIMDTMCRLYKELTSE